MNTSKEKMSLSLLGQVASGLVQGIITLFRHRNKASVLIVPMGSLTYLFCKSGKHSLIMSIDKNRMKLLESDSNLLGPLLEKDLRSWIVWLDNEFDLCVVMGCPDQIMIVRGLKCELIQKFAIHRVLPFKLEQQLPMDLNKLAIGYWIQEIKENSSWTTVHVCSLDNFQSLFEVHSNLLGQSIDLCYPQSLLLFLALNEERSDSFLFLDQIENVLLAFFSHEGKLLASKAISTDQGDIKTLVKHFEKVAKDYGVEAITIFVFDIKRDWEIPDMWNVEVLPRDRNDYLLKSLSLLDDPTIPSISFNLISGTYPDLITRVKRRWMHTVFASVLSFSFLISSVLFCWSSKNKLEAKDLYHHLQKKLESCSVDGLTQSPHSLEEAYDYVLDLLTKKKNQSFEYEFFSYPSLDKMIGFLCLESYPFRDVKQKPLVRLKKVHYSVRDKDNPTLHFSFCAKSENDIELFKRQVQSSIPDHSFSSLRWDIQELEGTCECLLINQSS
ncbi:hypothetical protein [Candidatus Similichlamydia epinepheli]|uniref:hypothetical protein n=1 Tax=Candidatus Similichlamydia epinepheli TaxID=1903953 RepID=UPI0013002EBF|nr:hypothetical protein [Candidatus Similichlamydia epinepheli]